MARKSRKQLKTDVEKLRDVVDIIVEVLEEIVVSRDIILPKTHRNALHKAWREVHKKVPTVIPDVVEDIKHSIEKVEPSALKGEGLFGHQLEYKLLPFHESYAEKEEKGGIHRLLNFLKFSEVLLDSLNAVPGIDPGVGAIKEIIGAVKWGVEKAEEPRHHH